MDRPRPPSLRAQWVIAGAVLAVSATLARVAYVGNHGSNLEQYSTYNDNAPDYVWFKSTGTAFPTGEFSAVQE